MSEATLYRCRTPSNWLCPCGRVARELARRDRDEIDELTGQQKVPVLVHGREVIVDSRRIVEHLRAS